MSSRTDSSNSQKQDVILNAICILFALIFLAFAVKNVTSAGSFLTIDSLFITATMLFLAGVFMIHPALWAHEHGLFAAEAEGDAPVVDMHFEGTTKLFLAVLGGLLLLTLVEVLLAYFHVPLVIMLTILIGLSVIKAALIVAYFMHLRFERMSLVLTLVPMLVICICLLFIFFPDSKRLLHMRTYGERTPAPTATAGEHE
ncbi:MAG TPA: cytochrome C oxidase subunit IV family protein [Pyrinomonadaceae bacterium]|jgi:cytochrome c oxidase subunit 4